MYSRALMLYMTIASAVMAEGSETITGQLVCKDKDCYIGNVKILPERYDQFATWTGKTVKVCGQYKDAQTFQIETIETSSIPVPPKSVVDCGCGLGERCCCGKVCDCALAKAPDPPCTRVDSEDGWTYLLKDGWWTPIGRWQARQAQEVYYTVPFGGRGSGGSRSC